jgi:tRNA-specific 2-thiouridylase
LEFYTKGQRQKLGLSGGPYFVVGKNTREGELIVSKNKDSHRLFNAQIILEKTNWLSRRPQIGKNYYFKIRSGAKPARGVLKMENSYWTVFLSRSQWGVASGQSVVAYDGQKVIGGGIIKKTVN